MLNLHSILPICRSPDFTLVCLPLHMSFRWDFSSYVPAQVRVSILPFWVITSVQRKRNSSRCPYIKVAVHVELLHKVLLFGTLTSHLTLKMSVKIRKSSTWCLPWRFWCEPARLRARPDAGFARITHPGDVADISSGAWNRGIDERRF